MEGIKYDVKAELDITEFAKIMRPIKKMGKDEGHIKIAFTKDKGIKFFVEKATSLLCKITLQKTLFFKYEVNDGDKTIFVEFSAISHLITKYLKHKIKNTLAITLNGFSVTAQQQDKALGFFILSKNITLYLPYYDPVTHHDILVPKQVKGTFHFDFGDKIIKALYGFIPSNAADDILMKEEDNELRFIFKVNIKTTVVGIGLSTLNHITSEEIGNSYVLKSFKLMLQSLLLTGKGIENIPLPVNNRD